ncbi:hypothetical protein B7463_g1423, partial [Scytalidium lignicola]
MFYLASEVAQPSRPNEDPKYFKSITYRHVRATPGVELPRPKPGEVIYVSKGQFLARGGTAIIERVPSGEVIKTPIPNPYDPREEEDCRQNMQLEAQIYLKIGEHPRIVQLVKWDPESHCLTLKYMENGSLQEYIEQNHDTITSELRTKWAKQAAEGLRVVHSFEIVHCDVSPRNFLLDSNLDIQICDFAGASISSSKSSAYQDTRFRSPDSKWEDPPSYKDDIFGFGSLIYFICTGKQPYGEIPSDRVDMLYTQREFPNVSHLPCGRVIEQCWHQQVDINQIYNAL